MMNPPRLEELARLWRRRTALREVFTALGAGCALAAIAALAGGTPRFGWLAAVAGSVTLLAVRLFIVRPWRIDAARVGSHLDRTYPELEESSHLWLRPPDGLSLPERLQRRRLDDAFTLLEKTCPAPAAPPRGFLRPGGLALAAGAAVLAVAVGYIVWRRGTSGGKTPAGSGTTATSPTLPPTPPTTAPVLTPPRIVDAELLLTPPAYTGRPERRVAGLDSADIEEGSIVAWRVVLDRAENAQELRLVFGQDEPLPLASTGGGEFRGQRAVSESTLYHLSGTFPDGTPWNAPEVHALKIRPDAPPGLTILQPPAPRTVVEPTPAADGSESPHVAVEVLASDDYGVTEAHLVATVTKGSGEAVKFREQTIAFDPEVPAGGDDDGPNTRRFVKTFNLAALGLEPGDELYFHVEAQDNRQPTPNRVRSETRFIVLRGPDGATAASGRGMGGVNLVPEYFRSQRQIIIDTERLVADRPSLPDAEFRRRANDLGIDQDLLRLRYGQFLGEESEQGAGDHVETSLNPLQPGVPADLVHQHDKPGAGDHPPAAAGNDPRAGLRTAMRLRLEHEEQAHAGGGHDEASPAAPDAGVPPTPAQILAPYVDQHDSQDKATFFDRETKGTLRDALRAMWEAEGFLRTARPAEALPAENRALVILKDLQQSARSYVQRVGFEPAPLKIAERRLRGDATGVPPRLIVSGKKLPDDEGALAPVRAALRTPPSALDRELLRRVEPALTEAAMRQPETFLSALGALRRTLTGGAGGEEEDLATVRRALWKLLPLPEARPSLENEAAPTLAESYFRALASPGPEGNSRP